MEEGEMKIKIDNWVANVESLKSTRLEISMSSGKIKAKEQTSADASSIIVPNKVIAKNNAKLLKNKNYTEICPIG
ncbi:hypothetical protein TNCV_387151 [Trichonephila clavipes]|nr:hypothetical protein TNCV_387151 [Trichonephila clavipes]